MKKAVLNTDAQKFIFAYKEELSKLAFSGSPFENVSVQELMQQIQGRNKVEKKLPTWFKTPGIFYPKKINLEQTSSEITAKYKASLIEGNTLADITGGFGVDSFYFSEKIKTVHHFEIEKELSEIAAHNFKVFKNENIRGFADDGLNAVLEKKYDVIFADPSRRNETKGKVFILRDCEPNIPENLSGLLNQCSTLLLKTSPMLDLSAGLKELLFVFEIHIVAVTNEVKEILWLVKKDFAGNPRVKTINFNKKNPEVFEFHWGQNAIPTFGPPQKYLFEPNAAIMKSGAFGLVSEKFKIDKLHPHTHLYTSEKLIEFPGRCFIIDKVVPYSKSEIRAAIQFKKANIATRNFPETPETLHKKWNLKDGGTDYLFFITDHQNRKQLLICRKAG